MNVQAACTGMPVGRGLLAQAALISLPGCPQKGRPWAARYKFARHINPGGIRVPVCGN